MKDDPDLPADWPPSLARIVHRCLRKDPGRRFQSMADVGLDLQDTLEEVEQGTAPHPAGQKKTGGLRNVLTSTLTALAVLLGGSWWLIQQRTTDAEWRALPLTSLPGWNSSQPSLLRQTRVAFMWDGGELSNQDIYVQQVNGATPPLRITTDPAVDSSPSWSPDGREIALLHFSAETTDVILVSALGGAERTVARLRREDLPLPNLRLPPSKIDWSPDGQFIALGTRTLSLVNVATGDLKSLSPVPAPGYDRDPAFSPGRLNDCVFPRW